MAEKEKDEMNRKFQGVQNIHGFDPETETTVKGTVTGIIFKEDEIRLQVGDKEIGMNDINAVYINNQQESNNRGNN